VTAPVTQAGPGARALPALPVAGIDVVRPRLRCETVAPAVPEPAVAPTAEASAAVTAAAGPPTDSVRVIVVELEIDVRRVIGLVPGDPAAPDAPLAPAGVRPAHPGR
jgi:hypothetical protein